MYKNAKKVRKELEDAGKLIIKIMEEEIEKGNIYAKRKLGENRARSKENKI